MSILAACFTTPALFLLLALTIKDGWFRSVLGPILTVSFVAALLGAGSDLSPPLRLLCSSLWLLNFIKGWSLLKVPREELKSYSPAGLLLYAYPWPGVDPAPFRERQGLDERATRWFVFGFPTMCLGIAALGMLALNSESMSRSVLGLAGIASMLTIIHLGYSDVLSSGMRLAGFPVKRLFASPLGSRSLQDFWSLRWNRPFVEMNKLLFRPLLTSKFSKGQTVIGLFLISGLLHELALSFPVSAGWGGPLLYFFVQGACMQLEKKAGISEKLWSRLWTWTVLLLPAPLLFHAQLREVLVLPLIERIHQYPAFTDWEGFFTTFLFLAGCGHFLVLVASFQVPYRLGWAEELPRLRPLNRKLLWTYGGYIASMILLWGVLTLYLTPEFLAGEKSAKALCAVIALFWWSRIVIDTFYFEHSDWPEGPEFVLGHTCLTTLFVTLASTYTGLLIWHFSN